MNTSAERRVENQLPQPARPPNSYDPSFQVQALEHSYYNNSVRHHDHKIRGEGRARDCLKSEVEGIFTKLDNMGRFPANSEDIQSRGIDHDSSHKLERFKVRTVVAEEVVQEEDKK